MNEEIDRWFDFVEEYYKQSTIPLSYALLPNAATTGFRAMGTPIGMTTLSKRKWAKLMEGDKE